MEKKIIIYNNKKTTNSKIQICVFETKKKKLKKIVFCVKNKTIEFVRFIILCFNHILLYNYNNLIGL